MSNGIEWLAFGLGIAGSAMAVLGMWGVRHGQA